MSVISKLFTFIYESSSSGIIIQVIDLAYIIMIACDNCNLVGSQQLDQMCDRGDWPDHSTVYHTAVWKRSWNVFGEAAKFSDLLSQIFKEEILSGSGI